MLLNIINAEYLDGYSLLLTFNNDEQKIVDLEKVIFNDHRSIFYPLKDKDFFKRFTIRFNTVEWENEADFAPEFLYEIGTAVE